jgi:hypothetical protein
MVPGLNDMGGSCIRPQSFELNFTNGRADLAIAFEDTGISRATVV